MDLSQTIKQYYFDHIDQLPADKQFHFASRLAAWEADPRAFRLLRKLQPYMLGDGQSIRNLLAEITTTPPSERISAYNLRQPFFEKYPSLYGAHGALFRVRHLKFVYGLEALNELQELVSKAELDKLTNQLLDDEEALRILSTFAINFIYLYKVILMNQKEFINPRKFLYSSRGYDLQSPKHLQLLIYLFTHCIIGEINFYIEKIAPTRVESYRDMLKILEQIIDENFDETNLDNKLEFLVCCRVCNFNSKLFPRIFRECEKSVSQEGYFIIDTHNKSRSKGRASFVKSEHRNVLYILSSSPYTPHSVLLQ